MKTGSSHAAAEAAASTSTSGGGASAKTAAAAAYASISGRGADAKTAAVGAIARSNDERCLRRRIQNHHTVCVVQCGAVCCSVLTCGAVSHVHDSWASLHVYAVLQCCKVLQHGAVS